MVARGSDSSQYLFDAAAKRVPLAASAGIEISSIPLALAPAAQSHVCIFRRRGKRSAAMDLVADFGVRNLRHRRDNRRRHHLGQRRRAGAGRRRTHRPWL